MMNKGNSITYLAELISALPYERPWIEELNKVIFSDSCVELPNNPEVRRNEFFLNISKMRLKSTLENKVNTFGIVDLIFYLEKLPADSLLERYGIKNNFFFGDCFVFNGSLIGCAFVKQVRTETKIGLSWLDK
ncbi:hypothetical protein [Serratia microhaemolytica]|uniref:hypothetical protein n=1 Tax=Serratia microhaemolytica TaxID=2675110 RepID=UPI000FDDA33F|nr:hypothetical protein [Serratia microhaemolytica]